MRPVYYTRLKSRRLTFIETLTTLVGWLVFVYLIIGLLTLLVWGGASYLIYLELFHSEVVIDTLYLFAYLILFALVVFVTLKSWIEFNYRRFGFEERRKKRSDISLNEIAESVTLLPREIESIRRWQVIAASFDGLFYRYKELPLEEKNIHNDNKEEPVLTGPWGIIFKPVPSEKQAAFLAIDKLKWETCSPMLTAGWLAYKKGGWAYLIGETLRDSILGHNNRFAHLLVTVPAAEMAESLQLIHGGHLVNNPLREEAELFSSDGSWGLHLSSDYFGRIKPGNALREKLSNEGFSINAMACSLRPDEMGRIYDYFGGLTDLERKLLRCTSFSWFQVNPFSVFYAVAIQESLGLSMEEETCSQLHQAITQKKYVHAGRVTGTEVAEKIFSLPNIPRIILALHQWDLFKHLFPRIPYSAKLQWYIENLSLMLDHYPHVNRPLIYYCALLYLLPPGEAAFLCHRLMKSRKNALLARNILKWAEDLTMLLRRENIHERELKELHGKVPFEAYILVRATEPISIVSRNLDRFLAL